MFNFSATLIKRFSGAFLGDKTNYISRKLGLIYWSLHTLTFIYLLSPIGIATKVYTMPQLLTDDVFTAAFVGLVGLYMGANVMDKTQGSDKASKDTKVEE
jgi:hypothetical protein